MNLYNAIMKAADHIEQHPEQFNFYYIGVPRCGTIGCAAGWIAHFAGHQPTDSGITFAVCDKLGFNYREFINRMYAIGGTAWRESADLCAKTMRLYAEKHHGHEKPRPTKALVADLMTKVMGEKIPEEA